jgi:hypothetical protein
MLDDSMTNCTKCGHEVRQRKDGNWQHAKIEFEVREPKTKQICDALYLSNKCLQNGCKCDAAIQGGGGGLMESLHKAGQVGEKFISGVSQV